MSLVRLQCPACSAIVKVTEEIVAQHPLVRCAKCQGLVTVATSRVIEPVIAPVANDDDVDFKPKKKKRKKQRAPVPVGLITGIIIGLLAMVGVGVGIYFLVDHFGVSGPEKTLKKTLAFLQKIVDTMESINTPDDVVKAKDKIAGLEREAKEIQELSAKTLLEVDPATNAKLVEKYMPQMSDLQSRLFAVIMKLQKNPQVAQALQNLAGSGGLGGEIFGNAGVVGGFNAPPQAFRPPNNFSNRQQNNSPPQNQNTGTSSSNNLMMFEHALLARNTLASAIPDVLSNVRDSDSAEHASLTLDAMVMGLKSQDQQLKEHERKLEAERINRNSQVVEEAQRDFKKTVKEIRLHLDRIKAMSDLRLVHGKMTRQLSEVGLYDNATTTASNDNPSDAGNPFQPSTSNNAGSKPTGSNPFEPSSSGSGNASKPQGNNPFEPAPSGNKNTNNPAMNSELDGTISKLTSTDHFKKMDGVREINSAKIDDARRKEVLEALKNLCEDSDMHQKADVVKAFKKWAATQEDKNLLGGCAESLLKDPWAKKDALRFYGENKVTSAAKEVARLLKDHFERKDAAEALIAMGSDVEKELTPYLSDLEPQVRQMAIEVLARIGTKASVPDLQRLLSDRAVGLAAKQAIQLINGRKK